VRSDSRGTFTERARRRHIVDRAIELIAEHGFVNASISRIADRSDVAKSVVLYYFATKDDLVTAIVERVITDAVEAMIPRLRTEKTAAGRLAAYIRGNCAFLGEHRVESVAMLEITTSFRTADGLRLDQAAARSVAARPPSGDLALLDPLSIIEDGVRTKEFAAVSPLYVKNALRAALDGAVWELARDDSYDVVGYGEELVTIFTRAVRKETTPRAGGKS
jgi:AcrR family transcriptional regulator